MSGTLYKALITHQEPNPLVAELDSGSGVIRPTYTDTYDNDMDCEWRVTTSENSVLYFHFESFDLEGSTGCPFDYVEVEDLSRPGLFLRG